MLSHWEKKKNPKQNKQIPQTNPETKSQAKVTVWEEEMSTVLILQVRNTLPGDDDYVCDALAELPS